MYITSIDLKNWRNYEKEHIEFINGTNIIYGDNAQGKTNILEAIFLFCLARSHRRATEREMIKMGEDYSVIKMCFCDDVRDYEGYMKILDGKKKYVSINGVSIKKISTVSKYINVVMFSPEDLSIVKDSPSYRRRFADMAISQLSPVYISYLNEYINVLNQRNNLLKMIKKTSKNADTLNIWDEYLVDFCIKIIKYRREFIKKLEQEAKKVHFEISGEDLSIKYISNCAEDIYLDDEKLSKQMLDKLIRTRSRDIETGMSNTGCHRDDFVFYTDKNDVKIYGSQGQQRSVVLSLKIGLTEVFKNIKGNYPVILLDDIMSELDEKRRSYLSGKIDGKQVILTCTDKEKNNYKNVKYFHIKNGKVIG